MSVAEKLKAEGRKEGRVEGRVEGLWIGKIQTFEEVLEKPQTSREILEMMSAVELEALHLDLRREYEDGLKHH